MFIRKRVIWRRVCKRAVVCFASLVSRSRGEDLILGRQLEDQVCSPNLLVVSWMPSSHSWPWFCVQCVCDGFTCENQSRRRILLLPLSCQTAGAIEQLCWELIKFIGVLLNLQTACRVKPGEQFWKRWRWLETNSITHGIGLHSWWTHAHSRGEGQESVWTAPFGHTCGPVLLRKHSGNVSLAAFSLSAHVPSRKPSAG